GRRRAGRNSRSRRRRRIKWRPSRTWTRRMPRKKRPTSNMPTNYVMPVAVHNSLVGAAFAHRGYTQDESSAAARFCELAARHGIKTHNAIKALHLDELF